MIELRRRYSGGVQSPSFSRLPKEYQEVEYLENTYSTSYINLGIKMQEDKLYSSKVDFEFSGKFNGGYSACIDGFYGVSPKDGFPAYCSMQITAQDSTILSYASNTKLEELQVIYSNNIITKRHVLEFNTANGSFIDGVNYSTETLKTHTSYDGKDSFFLFTRGARNGILKVETFFGKIYSYIFYEDGVAIRDLIPCYRRSDEVTGMYDIVNDVFYTNAGTGEFLCGPDVHYNIPPEYQQVEWLKGDGNAYIKTNFIVNSEQEFEITFRIDDFSSIQMLLGISSPYYRLYSHSVGGTNQIEFQYQNNVWNQNIESGEKYVFKKVGHKFYLNNIELPIQLSNNFQSVQDFYIFSCNGELGRYESKNYIYIIKLHDMQFIPCYRKEDNVAGMYDLVSGKFYTNAGTGTFEIGLPVIG